MVGENPLDTRWNAAKQELLDAANTAGVDPGVVVKIAGFESGFNPHARPIASHKREELNTVTQFDGTKAMSSAYGYGQFLDATWADMVRRHGEKYGVANAADLTDEQTNTAAMRNNTALQAGILAEFTRLNADKGSVLGGADAAANVYAMHNLGGSDGPKFLRSMTAHPDARVDSVLPSTVIERNSALYGDGSISLSDAYRNMGAQMERYANYADEVSQIQPARARDDSVSQAVKAQASQGSAMALPAHARALRDGMHGEDVRALQEKLNRLGYKDAHGSPLREDASFGPSTRSAIETFQSKNHLDVDGVVGPATLRRMSIEVEQQQVYSPAKPLQPTTHAAPAIPNPRLGLEDPRHPDSPNHGLYNELQRRIPDASENRLLQFTTACHTNKITADNLAMIYLDESGMKIGFFGSSLLSTPATVDLNTPPPRPQQAIQHIQHYDQQQAQMMGQIHAQNAQINAQAQQGPMR
jgi:putative peptidoglycan binding protein